MADKIKEQIYHERIEFFSGQLAGLKKSDRIFSLVKLLLVLAIILILSRVFRINQEYQLSVVFFFVLFFVIVAFGHETVLKKVKHNRTLKRINENELIYLRQGFPRGVENGEEYKDRDHAYTGDMDIFGEKGIFHYLNRSVTEMGRRCLADWLSVGAGVEEIMKRQEGVKELAGKIDLRQSVVAHGYSLDDSAKKLDGLFTFLGEKPFVLTSRGIKVLMVVGPVLTVGAFVAMAVGVPFLVPLLFFVGQLWVARVFFKRVSRVYKLTTQCAKVLKGYGKIIEDIEKGEYESGVLKSLKERLTIQGDGMVASFGIKKLGVLLEWFDVRRSGSMHFFLNHTLMWDLHCVYRIEKWRARVGGSVPGWFSVIGEFEALSSLASLCFNNPGWAMPEVVEGVFMLVGRDLGHPLIGEEERVCNDVVINEAGEEAGNLLIVTGPNMAGKSTFLRTVGVNMVLAFAGGPVCGRGLRVTRVKLYTSMQTSDSLDKHLSLFYAELQRLKMILDGMSRGESVFFIIDEMLKGTNALDRQKGAIAMLSQLIRGKANGIVATHDLELTKLQHSHIVNTHFDGTVEGDKLAFDYRLKEGTCTSFNALVLMKQMGIDL